MEKTIVSPAERIDALLEQVAQEYRMLPRRAHLKAEFRLALRRFNLPGGRCRPGVPARPLAESLKGESKC